MIQVITIARQLGAGGREAALRLADSLGWRLLDRALVERIAAELHADPREVEACDERVESFGERLGVYLSEMYPEITPLPALPPVSPELAARAARRVVSAVIDEGPSVIVGHGAQCVLRDDPRAFHVLLHAPRGWRIRRASERFGDDAEAAEERIRASDADRRRYLREHFGHDWLDPALYHLCVDSGRIGIAAAVDLIRAAADSLGRAPASGAPPRGRSR
jgi:hypothetical protein